MHRPADRHQHRHLLAVRRQPRHRLRHPGQHGQGGRRLRQDGQQVGATGPGSARGCRSCPPTIAESLGLDRPVGALVAVRRAEGPGGGGGAEDRRRHPRRRRPGGRRPRRLRLPLRHQADRRQRRRSPSCAAARQISRAGQAGAGAGDAAARRASAQGPLAAWPALTVANMSPAVAEELSVDAASEGVVVTEVQDDTARRASSGLQKGDLIVSVDGEMVIDDARTSRSWPKAAQLLLEAHHRARRPGRHHRRRRLSCAGAGRSLIVPNLFEAAGLEKGAPRPLADRLRPTRLAEVVGQDHLVGPDGALTRLHRLGLAGLADLLGAARHRQDHRRAAARQRDDACISSRSRPSSPASPT